MLWLARPEWSTWAAGAAIAACGELLRLWAAGHLEKSREVTASGPYRYVRHPLYMGSSLIGIGLAIASTSLVVAAIIGIYLGLTLSAARRSEEAHLREKFGDAYDAYVEKRMAPMTRTFSLERALAKPRAPHDRRAGRGIRAARREDRLVGLVRPRPSGSVGPR